MARPIPVLPEVPSTIVPPGFSSPARSASSIILTAMRSLIELPGLKVSSLISTSALMMPGVWLSPRGHVAAQSLPANVSDRDFWAMVTGMSEPGGFFRSDNLISNEMAFQHVIPELQKTPRPGAYIGVGPDQNFTYITALKPKMAFIVDIRRQNMIQQLMYKALFELSTDRADFLSKLFSRPRPTEIEKDADIELLMAAFHDVPGD